MSNIKKLFTPGPLSTSETVKSVMNIDLGSRDDEFIAIVKSIRERLLQLAGVKKSDYETILMQGSGTFGVESILNSVIKKDGKILIVINGAYGNRIRTICERLYISTVELYYKENQTPNLKEIEELLTVDKEITHISIVHCETTTGIINPIDRIGDIAFRYNKEFIVDAMSSFGAYSIDFYKSHIDYLVSSSNKCIEGVPGFSFIIANKEKLCQKKGVSSSLSLDLYEQWENLEKTGQFRFTPPIHSLLAFNKALDELDKEGGIAGRSKRYKENNSLLLNEMEKLGFEKYLDPEDQGYIITTFYYPDNENFNFETFYRLLSQKGFIIYPGKLTSADCFRIGNIGHIFKEDIQNLISAIKETLAEMNVNLL